MKRLVICWTCVLAILACLPCLGAETGASPVQAGCAPASTVAPISLASGQTSVPELPFLTPAPTPAVTCNLQICLGECSCDLPQRPHCTSIATCTCICH